MPFAHHFCAGRPPMKRIKILKAGINFCFFLLKKKRFCFFCRQKKKKAFF